MRVVQVEFRVGQEGRRERRSSSHYCEERGEDIDVHMHFQSVALSIIKKRRLESTIAIREENKELKGLLEFGNKWSSTQPLDQQESALFLRVAGLKQLVQY